MAEINKNIYTQLSLCDFESIEKDSKNPHLKNLYASLPKILSVVIPVLKKNGIVLSSYMKENHPDVYVVTLTHGESMTGVSSHIKLLNTADMQKWGGSVTYATRYGLLSLLGIAADMDDDGNTASEQQNSRVNPVTQAFKPVEMPADQLAKLKTDLLGLWEMKKEVAAEKFPVKATSVSQILTNDFTKTTESGEVVPAESIDLIKIQTWLKGI